jgi:phosphocarrier protein HPr
VTVFATEPSAFDAADAKMAVAIIGNAKGLHARASAKFVRMAEQFAAETSVRCRGQTVSGRSIMGLLMLSASPGTEIEIAAAGADAQKAVDALCGLVRDGFGEKDEPANTP